MEGSAGTIIGLAAAQIAGGAYFIGGNIFLLLKGLQDALGAIQSLVCIGMDS
jgi:hypothetical protein